MSIRVIIGAYCEKHVNWRVKFTCKIQRFLTLKQVLYIATTVVEVLEMH